MIVVPPPPAVTAVVDRPAPKTTATPSAKRTRRKAAPRPSQTSLPDELGRLIERDASEVASLGWEEFVRRRRGRGDFGKLTKLRHPARRLLRQYKFRGAPVVLSGRRWTEEERLAVLSRGPHRSAIEHAPFLRR